ncbi:uncharacterized protein FIBRA_08224 [Fibroporia radiculosa]|uniref:Uncharacterized protein n=1 Tax=Fibroporia radiculosa TaxID=599839 RepID=J4GGV4_9APHY|nr:uncharacterized protein FIBRA_08224 [Fibroporia radiculosa]CCM05983.1 predicted protein [Fibroporia radiculosa]
MAMTSGSELILNAVAVLKEISSKGEAKDAALSEETEETAPPSAGLSESKARADASSEDTNNIAHLPMSSMAGQVKEPGIKDDLVCPLPNSSKGKQRDVSGASNLLNGSALSSTGSLEGKEKESSMEDNPLNRAVRSSESSSTGEERAPSSLSDYYDDMADRIPSYLKGKGRALPTEDNTMVPVPRSPIPPEGKKTPALNRGLGYPGQSVMNSSKDKVRAVPTEGSSLDLVVRPSSSPSQTSGRALPSASNSSGNLGQSVSSSLKAKAVFLPAQPLAFTLPVAPIVPFVDPPKGTRNALMTQIGAETLSASSRGTLPTVPRSDTPGLKGLKETLRALMASQQTPSLPRGTSAVLSAQVQRDGGTVPPQRYTALSPSPKPPDPPALSSIPTAASPIIARPLNLSMSPPPSQSHPLINSAAVLPASLVKQAKATAPSAASPPSSTPPATLPSLLARPSPASLAAVSPVQAPEPPVSIPFKAVAPAVELSQPEPVPLNPLPPYSPGATTSSTYPTAALPSSVQPPPAVSLGQSTSPDPSTKAPAHSGSILRPSLLFSRTSEPLVSSSQHEPKQSESPTSTSECLASSASPSVVPVLTARQSQPVVPSPNLSAINPANEADVPSPSFHESLSSLQPPMLLRHPLVPSYSSLAFEERAQHEMRVRMRPAYWQLQDRTSAEGATRTSTPRVHQIYTYTEVNPVFQARIRVDNDGWPHREFSESSGHNEDGEGDGEDDNDDYVEGDEDKEDRDEDHEDGEYAEEDDDEDEEEIEVESTLYSTDSLTDLGVLEHGLEYLVDNLDLVTIERTSTVSAVASTIGYVLGATVRTVVHGVRTMAGWWAG